MNRQRPQVGDIIEGQRQQPKQQYNTKANVTQSAQRTLDEKKKQKKIGFHICRRSKNGIEKNPEKSRSCVTSYAYDSARWQCTSAFGIGSGIVLRVIRHITHSSSPRQGVGGGGVRDEAPIRYDRGDDSDGCSILTLTSTSTLI